MTSFVAHSNVSYRGPCVDISIVSLEMYRCSPTRRGERTSSYYVFNVSSNTSCLLVCKCGRLACPRGKFEILVAKTFVQGQGSGLKTFS